MHPTTLYSSSSCCKTYSIALFSVCLYSLREIYWVCFDDPLRLYRCREEHLGRPYSQLVYMTFRRKISNITKRSRKEEKRRALCWLPWLASRSWPEVQATPGKGISRSVFSLSFRLVGYIANLKKDLSQNSHRIEVLRIGGSFDPKERMDNYYSWSLIRAWRTAVKI